MNSVKHRACQRRIASGARLARRGSLLPAQPKARPRRRRLEPQAKDQLVVRGLRALLSYTPEPPPITDLSPDLLLALQAELYNGRRALEASLRQALVEGGHADESCRPLFEALVRRDIAWTEATLEAEGKTVAAD